MFLWNIGPSLNKWILMLLMSFYIHYITLCELHDIKRRVSHARNQQMKVKRWAKASVGFSLGLPFKPWIWKCHVPPKCQAIPELYCITSQRLYSSQRMLLEPQIQQCQVMSDTYTFISSLIITVLMVCLTFWSLLQILPAGGVRTL